MIFILWSFIGPDWKQTASLSSGFASSERMCAESNAKYASGSVMPHALAISGAIFTPLAVGVLGTDSLVGGLGASNAASVVAAGFFEAVAASGGGDEAHAALRQAVSVMKNAGRS